MKTVEIDKHRLTKGTCVLLVYSDFVVPSTWSKASSGTPPLLFYSNGLAELVDGLNLPDSVGVDHLIMRTEIDAEYPRRWRDEEYLQKELSNKRYEKRNELGRDLKSYEIEQIELELRAKGLFFQKACKAETLVRKLISPDEIERYLRVIGPQDNRFIRLLHARNSLIAGFLYGRGWLNLTPEPENYPWRQRYLGQFPDKKTTVPFGNRSFAFYEETAPVVQVAPPSTNIRGTQGWFSTHGLQEIIIGAERINDRLLSVEEGKIPGGPYPRLVDSKLVSDITLL